jgi:hypothetical protein
MRGCRWDRDRPRADAVRTLLTASTKPSPVDAVDWHTLHERIMAGASTSQLGPVVAAVAPAWRHTARSVAMALPIGMAAGLIAALTLTQLSAVSDVRPSVLAALKGDLSVSTLAAGVVSPDAERYVVSAVLGE